MMKNMVAAASSVLVATSLCYADKSPEAMTNALTSMRIWAGYGSYAMGDFNDKLASENNQQIDGGMNLGIDISVFTIDLKLPSTVPGVNGSNKIRIPLGVEYLEASSQSTHGGATVEWNLPVVGLYCAPEIVFAKRAWLYIRPLGLGYYTLGSLLNADLSVSDRPGAIDVSGGALGISTQVGVKYPIEQCDLFAQLGYRRLVFADVDQDPHGGFTESVGGRPVQAGKLKEDLDYSGLSLVTGICWNF